MIQESNIANLMWMFKSNMRSAALIAGFFGTPLSLEEIKLRPRVIATVPVSQMTLLMTVSDMRWIAGKFKGNQAKSD